MSRSLELWSEPADHLCHLGGGGGGAPSGGGAMPRIYEPGAQPQADVQWQNILQNMLGEYGGGQGAAVPGIQAWPSVQQSTQDILANPFRNQMPQGYQSAADIFTGQYLPMSSGVAQNAFGMGDLARYLQPSLINSTLQNPAYAQAQGLGTPLASQMIGAGSDLLGGGYGQSAYRDIGGASHDLLTGGYGPAVWQNLGGAANQLLTGGYGQSAYQRDAGAANELATGGYGPAAYQRAAGSANELLTGGYGPAAYRQLAGLIPGITAQANRAAPQLSGAASQILGQAFDPQQALYDRTQQRLREQQGASLAGSGMLNTPYGQSVMGDTMSNFNIDWQNQQLNRMTQGGQAANALQAGALGQLTGAGSAAQGLELAGLQGLMQPMQTASQLDQAALEGLMRPMQTASQLDQAALEGLMRPMQTASQLDLAGIQGLLAPAQAGGSLALQGLQGLISPAQAGAGLQTQGLQSILQPANAQTAAATQGTGALGNLMNQSLGGYNAGLGAIGNQMSQYGPMMSGPYNAYNQSRQADFGALQNLINLGNAKYQLPEQLMGNLQSYMQLGQSADRFATDAALQANSQNMQGLAGLGGLGASMLNGPLGFGGSSGGLLGGALGMGGFNPLTGAGAVGPFMDASGGAGLETLMEVAPLAIGS